MKTKALMCAGLSIVALAFTGCSDDDKRGTGADMAQQTRMSTQADAAADDILTVIESEYSEQNPNGRNGLVTPFLPECATVTTTATGNTWQRVVNFGTTGCTLPNGNVVSGIINISGTTDYEALSQTITYSLQNFYHNGILIEGNKYAVRVLENTNGNPQSTIQLDLDLTFPNGTGATRTGSRVWEWVAGADTPLNPFDNEYLVTGQWATAFPDNTLATTVTSPLRVKLNCAHIVEGSLHFATNNNEADLDYGSGACDAQATLSINGGAATTIILQ